MLHVARSAFAEKLLLDIFGVISVAVSSAVPVQSYYYNCCPKVVDGKVLSCYWGPVQSPML